MTALTLRSFARRLSFSGALVLLLCAGGCQSSSRAKDHYINIERVPKRDDIVRVVQFWNPVPWIYDSTNRVIGFKVPTYFISSKTEKGAFVTGTVFVWLHLVERDKQGKIVRRTVHIWQMEKDEVFLFAIRKEAIGGYYHGFILTWPTNLDLAGRDVEIEFGYQRGDGRLVMASPRDFRVPGDASSPIEPPQLPPREPEAREPEAPEAELRQPELPARESRQPESRVPQPRGPQ